MELHGMMYDNVRFDRYFVVENIRRSFTPEILNTYTEAIGRRGLYHTSQNNGSRKIEIDIRFIETKREDVLYTVDVVRPLLIKNKPKKLTLRDYPNRYELAILETSDFNINSNTGFAILTFTNPEGFMYSDTTFDETNNGGTLETPFILEGVSTGSKIKITSPKEELIMIDGISPGKNILIDTEKEEIFIGGEKAMDKVNFLSDFFWLDLGENNIKVEGLKDFKYRHRRRYV